MGVLTNVKINTIIFLLEQQRFFPQPFPHPVISPKVHLTEVLLLLLLPSLLLLLVLQSLVCPAAL